MCVRHWRLTEEKLKRLAAGELPASRCSVKNTAVKKLKMKHSQSGQEGRRLCQHTRSRLLSHTHLHTGKINPEKL